MRATLMARLCVLVILLTAPGCSPETILGLLGSLALLFNQAGLRPPTNSLNCGTADAHYHVSPGTCALLVNACNRVPEGPRDGAWVNTDSFAFDDGAPGWLSVRTVTVTNSSPTRQICVAPGAPPVFEAAVGFSYFPVGTEGTAFGQGTLLLSTVAELLVQVSATPSVLDLGQSTQLDAVAFGGQPPYTFAWSQSDSGLLSNPAIANPVATPNTVPRIVYTVVVGDAIGQQVTGGLEVRTQPVILTVGALPGTIDPGETSQLSVTIQSGSGPFTFSWTPTSGLDDPTSQSPRATPATTTTYTVAVTPANGGDTFLRAVTVSVNPLASATATPSIVTAGQTAQLQANVQGGTPPYTFAWTPPDTLNASSVADPVATPSATTSYTVRVTDAVGTTTAASATVTVASGPVADFTFTFDGIETLYLDASASTGDIVRYEWAFTWERGETVAPSPTLTFTANPDTTGTITLIVTDRSGATSTRTRAFP